MALRPPEQAMRRFKYIPESDGYIESPDGQWCHIADVMELEELCREIVEAQADGRLGLIGFRSELLARVKEKVA